MLLWQSPTHSVQLAQFFPPEQEIIFSDENVFFAGFFFKYFLTIVLQVGDGRVFGSIPQATIDDLLRWSANKNTDDYILM